MASVTRGMDKLGLALAAWQREQHPTGPLFPSQVFSAIGGGFDLALTYDVGVQALVHRSQDPTLTLPPDASPMALALFAAARATGAKVQFKGERLLIVAPTPNSIAEQRDLLSAARRGRVVGGPLLEGVDPARVWFDGIAPLDIKALVGSASPARRRVVERATGMVSHRWEASEKNTFHGLAADGVWTDTPDDTYMVGGFSKGKVNVGLPYFWGGFSDLASFDRGVAAGLPAGHVFKVTRTFREDNAFTPLGVGVDCSGFVAQAWGLDEKVATGAIEEMTRPLADYSELRPGDVVMKVWQHVMLFVGRDGDKLLFMESTPPRCIGQAFTAKELAAMEMLPRAAKWLDK